MNKKKILIVLLAVLAIIAATVLILIKTGKLKLEKTKPTPAKVDLPPAPKYTKTDLPTDQLPEIFPKDLIQEQDPIITTNFMTEKEDSTKTYTVQYFSKNTQQQIFRTYVDYLIKNKWGLLPDNKVSENLSYISAVLSKEKRIIYINSSINEISKMTLVNITLVQYK